MNIQLLNEILTSEDNDELLKTTTRQIRRQGLSQEEAYFILDNSKDTQIYQLLLVSAYLSLNEMERAKQVLDALVEQGLSFGMVARARMYRKGQCEIDNYPNYTQAAILLDKAIEQGDTEAMVYRAWMYRKGQGEFDHRPNYLQTIALLDRAMAQGDIQAMVCRATMHRNGQGTSDNLPDYLQAMALFDRAVAQDDTEAVVCRAWMYSKGQGEFEHRPNHLQTIALLDRAMAQGDTEAMVCRAIMYRRGEGELDNLPNYAQAIVLLDKAILQGNAEAMVERARMYRKGQGEFDHLQTIALLDRAMAQGDTKAMVCRAIMYRRGEGELDNLPDYAQAMALFDRAVAQDDTEAMVFHAIMYRDGQGTLNNRPDYTQAMALFDRAIVQGYPRAMVARACMYRDGKGEVDSIPNYTQAMALIHHAMLRDTTKQYSKTIDEILRYMQKMCLPAAYTLFINHYKINGYFDQNKNKSFGVFLENPSHHFVSFCDEAIQELKAFSTAVEASEDVQAVYRVQRDAMRELYKKIPAAKRTPEIKAAEHRFLVYARLIVSPNIKSAHKYFNLIPQAYLSEDDCFAFSDLMFLNRAKGSHRDIVVSFASELATYARAQAFKSAFKELYFNEAIFSEPYNKIREILSAIKQLRCFAFQDGKITTSQIKLMLGLVQTILDASHDSASPQDQNFIAILKKFAENIDDLASKNIHISKENQILCLQVISQDYSSTVWENNSIFTPILSKLLTTSKTLEQDLPKLELSCVDSVEGYISQACLPYMQIMEPGTINQIMVTYNTTPILDFIIQRYGHASCIPDPMYAPTGEITAQGVKDVLNGMIDLPLLLDSIRTHDKFVITAGVMPDRTTTAQDQKNWPKIITRLFHEILSSRLFILNCIKGHQAFRPNQPKDLAELISVLHQLDHQLETPFRVESRILANIGKLLPSDMPLSYHVIFSTIASMITYYLLERVGNKKEQELILQHTSRESEDDIYIETAQFNQEMMDLVYSTVKTLIAESWLPKIRNWSIHEFMAYVEMSGERRVNVLNLHAMGSKLSKQPQKEHAHLIREGLVSEASMLARSIHYDRVQYFIPEDDALAEPTPLYQRYGIFSSHNAAVKWCLKTLHTIAQQPMHTLNELLLLVSALSHRIDNQIHYYGHINTADLPVDERPWSEEEHNHLCQSIPSMLENFLIFRELQGATYQGSDNLEIYQQETDRVFDRMLVMIKNNPQLFSAYCQYHLGKESVEAQHAHFFVKHFNQAKQVIQTQPEYLANLFELCRPSWDKSTQVLKETLEQYQQTSCCSSMFSYGPKKSLPYRMISNDNNSESKQRAVKWRSLGAGSFNFAYINADKTLVFKLMHELDPAYQQMDEYERSVRLWNQINPRLSTPARLQKALVDGNFESGWVCPYVDGRQSTDSEMKQAVIDIFNRTGRIVVDATADRNFLTTADDAVVLIDIGWALCLDIENLAGQAISQTSHEGWQKFDCSLFSLHYSVYPETIDTIKALLFIKLNRPEITNVNFLKQFDQGSMEQLTRAFDERILLQRDIPSTDAVFSLLALENIKTQCRVRLECLSMAPKPSALCLLSLYKKSTGYEISHIFSQLMQNIRVTHSIEELSQHVEMVQKTLKNTKITENINVLLGDCMLLIAEEKPEAVDFDLTNDLLRRV